MWDNEKSSSGGNLSRKPRRRESLDGCQTKWREKVGSGSPQVSWLFRKPQIVIFSFRFLSKWNFEIQGETWSLPRWWLPPQTFRTIPVLFQGHTQVSFVLRRRERRRWWNTTVKSFFFFKETPPQFNHSTPLHLKFHFFPALWAKVVEL